jgi:hypothetical protein
MDFNKETKRSILTLHDSTWKSAFLFDLKSSAAAKTPKSIEGAENQNITTFLQYEGNLLQFKSQYIITLTDGSTDWFDIYRLKVMLILSGSIWMLHVRHFNSKAYVQFDLHSLYSIIWSSILWRDSSVMLDSRNGPLDKFQSTDDWHYKCSRELT